MRNNYRTIPGLRGLLNPGGIPGPALLKNQKEKYGFRKMHFALSAMIMLVVFSASAQKGARQVESKCGTMQRLQILLDKDPALKQRFETQRTSFNEALRKGSSLRLQNKAGRITDQDRVVYTIPVVFHIVLPNPNVVTDAQLQAQIDTLNKDYFGENSDTVKIPSYFKPLFGRSSIQFCLAKRTPDGDETTGIERVTTTKTSFSYTDDAVKTAITGGADSWDGNKYMNVWITTLSGGLLGYSTFPEDGAPAFQGVVIDYRSLPGGSLAEFNEGKTLTHESGHFFNLYHIWGDDDGACTGTDYVDDTPNQSDATSGCYSGVKTDNCTPGGNGIMYQNYMDYSDDPCLVMFTQDQVTRMETALVTYRPSLLTSDGCQPAVLQNYDAQLRTINQPAQRVCAGTFAPVVTIRNRGTQLLTSATINIQVDKGAVSTYNWTGSLAHAATATVTLNNVTTSTGTHTLTVYTTNPDNQQDQNITNDTLTITYQYYEPVSTVAESFENTQFPPQGWDIVNPDQYITWKRVTGVGNPGSASVMMDNFNYNYPGQHDDLRMPTINIASTVDTAILSFNVAAATYTASNTSGNVWDTLQVLVSTDCGQTYTSLYKKWANTLVTRTAATVDYFVPSAGEWRKDSIDLAGFIGKGDLLIAFRNTTGYENNIYLDNVNLRTVTINPNLKAQGVLVTPSPTTGTIAVQFYPQPNKLKAIQIFSATGQKVAETLIGSGANNYYSYDLSAFASGVYLVRAVFSDHIVVRRVVKL